MPRDEFCRECGRKLKEQLVMRGKHAGQRKMVCTSPICKRYQRAG